MEIVRYLFYFFIYSFGGWVSETLYALYVHRKFVNRGFCTGPWCPMYGVSAILLTFGLGLVRTNALLIFLIGAALVTLVEYVTSFVLEKFFKTKWWDYHDKKFNVNGRVCLTFSLLWGLFSFVLVWFIHPFIINTTALISEYALVWVTCVISVFFIVDLGATLASLLHLKQRLRKLSMVFDRMKEQGESRVENLTGDLKTMYQKQIGRLPKRQKRLLNAFPNARSWRFGEALDKLRDSLVMSKHKKLEREKPIQE